MINKYIFNVFAVKSLVLGANIKPFYVSHLCIHVNSKKCGFFFGELLPGVIKFTEKKESINEVEPRSRWDHN